MNNRHNLYDMLDNVIKDAMSVGFPISESLEKEIYIDMARYDRVGACYRYPYPEKYEIHLSEDTLKASKFEIKNIIAHEVLHSHFLTREHNWLWQHYCTLMEQNFGYKIQIVYSWKKLLK